MANTFRNDTYRSLRNYSYLAMGFLGVELFILVFYIVGCVVMIAAPECSIGAE